MKSAPRYIIAIAALSLAGLPRLTAQGQAVLTTQARQESLTAAEKLLAAKPAGVPADAIDPFHSAAFAAAASAVGSEAAGQNSGTGTTAQAETHAGPRTGRELIAAIAASLKPNGYFVMGGQSILTFGEKRVKAGMPLTITFEGVEYTVEVTAITNTSFTLRLNREEFTRPIK